MHIMYIYIYIYIYIDICVQKHIYIYIYIYNLYRARLLAAQARPGHPPGHAAAAEEGHAYSML